MKREYAKPSIEFEDFELNTAIAAGCTVHVNMGPGDKTHTPCGDYTQPEYIQPEFGIMAELTPGNFYEGSCTCYLNASGGVMFTS